MKNFLIIMLTTIASVFVAQYIVLAQLEFKDATWPAPTQNVLPPLNVGGGRQEKKGDLTVQNLKAASITLGDITRTTWPDVSGGGGSGGGSCAWEGVRCHCSSGHTSVGGGWFSSGSDLTVRNISMVSCSSGTLRDARHTSEIYGYYNGNVTCPAESLFQRPDLKAIYGCTPGLYSKIDY